MFKYHLASLRPTLLNGWVIQGSILNNTNICIILHNVDFNVTIVRYFTDEEKAYAFTRGLIYGDRDVSEKSK